MRTLLKNARILKMDDTPLFLSNIVIENNRIIYIGNEYNKYFPFDIQRDCLGNVIMPGFKNAHTHSAMTFLRSKTDDYKLQNWLFDVVFPREKYLTEDRVYKFAKVAFLEYLTSGITACLDQYFFPFATKKAAEEIGMRVVLQGTFSKNHCGVLDMVNNYHTINSDVDSLVKYVIGYHAEYTFLDEEVPLMIEAVKKTHSPFFIHLSETKNEVEDCYHKRRVSPLKYLTSLGLFDYGGGCFHCVHLIDDDIQLMKKYHLSVVTCPGSNSKLASGIAPISKYLKEGLNVAIGTDGPASNNCLDMFKEMMLVSSLSKLKEETANTIPAYEILKMATVNGSQIMGNKDNDILEVGKLADLIEIDLSRPSMQPLNNIVENIVYSGAKDIIKMTMINGRILYDQGQFNVGQDIFDIYKEAQEESDNIENEALANE